MKSGQISLRVVKYLRTAVLSFVNIYVRPIPQRKYVENFFLLLLLPSTNVQRTNRKEHNEKTRYGRNDFASSNGF